MLWNGRLWNLLLQFLIRRYYCHLVKEYNKSNNFMSNNSFNDIFKGDEVSPVKETIDEEDYGVFKVHLISDKKSQNLFGDVYMVQEFPANNGPIWIAEFSPTWEYLATAGRGGVIKIWLIQGEEYKEDPYLLFNENPIWELWYDRENTCSILDLSWCQKAPDFILEARIDGLVVLWNFQTPDFPVATFEHKEAVSWVEFHTMSDESNMYFLTGCLDKTYQVWKSDNKEEPICSQQAKDYITALAVSPDGLRVVLGLSTGQIIVWAYDNAKLNYVTSIECKNRQGKFSKGTKVTGVHFLDNTRLMVTTNDSRIRIVNVEGRTVDSGSKHLKFKGIKNENMQIRADISDDLNHIIWGSEDGYIYVWNPFIDDPKVEK